MNIIMQTKWVNSMGGTSSRVDEIKNTDDLKTKIDATASWENLQSITITITPKTLPDE